ncbi:M14 family metallopeptidase [Bradyrhizobium diazoefficiens]|uniref:M14 family metallopeptidase n=1 Tax=Bradyrhizobium diazoefficiens TaxID=1355477 RepID=UPI00190B2F9D|nr:M14 family metallopeptidase [Bradyrhizobium diazoefficiens]QQO35581.1 M14 family metallopeptidase [Bradyrhizobium diazoefficiens]
MNDAIVDAANKHFSSTYFEARQKFRDYVADAAVGHAAVYPSAARGPRGEELSTDVAWFGDRRAPKVAIMISGTHGVEGYCGSAAQLDWLAGRGYERLKSDEAILLIHALNPYGFAWDRRVTQEGCDLNRNFVDFTGPLPDNEAYDLLADSLVPRELDGPLFAAAEATIGKFRTAHGELALRKARTSGQYRHPTGIFFGGFAPTVARQTLERIVLDYGIESRRFVLIVDYHTGLGPYGYGELQCEQASGMFGYQRAHDIFGPSVTSPDLGTSSAVALNGTQDDYWQRLLGDRHVYVCLEFGTYPTEAVRAAMRADHWLYAYRSTEFETDVGYEIRRRLKQVYYPERADWQEMVLYRSRQVHRQMIEGLRL